MAHAAQKHESQTASSLDHLLAEIRRAFAWWSKRYWPDKPLSKPHFLFAQQLSNGNRLGHYHPDIWIELRDGERVRRPEIVFYSDLCLSRGPVQVMQTLLHEMAHHWQQEQGKSGKNNYHNAQWHAEAQRVGLLTSGPLGRTKPGPGFLADLELFGLRVDLIPWRDSCKRQKGKQRKWTCACGYAVRVAKQDFDATCNRCGQEFTLEEG